HPGWRDARSARGRGPRFREKPDTWPRRAVPATSGGHPSSREATSAWGWGPRRSRKGSSVNLRRVKITGLSTYVPPRVLTNADLEKLVETSNEWILQRTGIRERHIVDKGVATSDLAKEAALGAMAQAGVGPDDLGFIVVGTTTPDTIFPSTACMLQTKL